MTTAEIGLAFTPFLLAAVVGGVALAQPFPRREVWLAVCFLSLVLAGAQLWAQLPFDGDCLK